MYFDAVLTKSSMKPVFNGTPEDTLKFLEQNSDLAYTHEVCIGKTLRVVSVKEYLEVMRKAADVG